MEPIITKNQTLILSEFQKNSFLTDNFYFTGGTALSNYYLKHRYSEDLDFFSERPFELSIILTILSQWSKKQHFTYKVRSIEDITHMFNLEFKSGETLRRHKA